MRQPKESDFLIHLEGVGDFRFSRPTILDQANIRADFLKLAGEHASETYPVSTTNGRVLNLYKEHYVTTLATIYARHKHLCIEAPTGWKNLEELELSQWHEDKLSELHAELGVALDNFRQGAGSTSKNQSQGHGADVSVLVSEEVPSPAE